MTPGELIVSLFLTLLCFTLGCILIARALDK